MAKSPSPREDPPPPLLRIEEENRLPAVEPSPPLLLELLDPAVDFLVEVRAAAVRSVNRLVEPRLAPRLDADIPPPFPSESSEEEVLFALLDDVISTVDALCEPEPDELDEDEEVLGEELLPPNTLADADIELREEPRLPL